jgi:hypothetical protein
VLKKIRDSLARRGARGILGLGKQFRIMDDDYSGALSRPEFYKAMRDYKIMLTDQVCDRALCARGVCSLPRPAVCSR